MPGSLDLSFSQLRSSVLNSEERWQHLLQVEGELCIKIEGIVFFNEPMFPLVELAAYARQWLHSPDQDFLFASLETEENPLIAFYSSGSSFRAESPWADRTGFPLIESAELISAFTSFVEQVRLRVNEELDLDISIVIPK